MRGLFIGRFQPFHKGHLSIIKRISEECESVLIGVGSAQKERENRNPLSGGERIEMIGRVLDSRGISPYRIYPVPDIDCYPAWPYYVRAILPSFDVVYSNSSAVLRLFKNTRIDVRELEDINRDEWKGAEIRRRIIEGEEWKYLVPNEIIVYLEEIDMESRLKPVIGMKSEVERKVSHLLTKKEMTISTAESCTGGLIGHRLTNVPGSSSYFERGVITYSNQSKIEVLDVDNALIEEEGAVSEGVAIQMAEGIRKKAGTDIGLATTGIAGPGGGSEEKPVGTVYMGFSSEAISKRKKYQFSGNRWDVKKQTSEKALEWIIERLEKK